MDEQAREEVWKREVGTERVEGCHDTEVRFVCFGMEVDRAESEERSRDGRCAMSREEEEEEKRGNAFLMLRRESALDVIVLGDIMNGDGWVRDKGCVFVPLPTADPFSSFLSVSRESGVRHHRNCPSHHSSI